MVIYGIYVIIYSVIGVCIYILYNIVPIGIIGTTVPK